MMLNDDSREVSELVETADVALRAASELRKLRGGHPVRDEGVLNRAAEMLASAREGGIFVSGKGEARLSSSLRPLQWASQTYIFSERPVDREREDPEAFFRFLEDVMEVVRSATEGRSDERIERAASFLQVLGELVGNRADDLIRRGAKSRVLFQPA